MLKNEEGDCSRMRGVHKAQKKNRRFVLTLVGVVSRGEEHVSDQRRGAKIERQKAANRRERESESRM